MTIRNVWRDNFEFEMALFARCLPRYNVISIDTEFPGNLVSNPRTASEDVRYSCIKQNVDKTKIIQLGITLSAGDGRGFVSWQFNFSDFHPAIDAHNKASIALLFGNGFDFENMKLYGINSRAFGFRFLKLISTIRRTLRWVTFHGLYDFAYLLKTVTGGVPLPETVEDFTETIGELFGFVYDVKYMARFCDGLFGGELGLEKLANILQIDRIGESHQAGSDSLLTAMAFELMNGIYPLDESQFLGFLYGIETKVVSSRPVYLPMSCGNAIPTSVLSVPVEVADCSGPIDSDSIVVPISAVPTSSNQFGFVHCFSPDFGFAW